MSTKTQKRRGSSSYRSLAAWQLGMDVVETIYRITERFPREERFGLTAQLRRGSVSVPSNLAEGNERSSKADKRHFVVMARGSVAEVETQLEIALRLGFVNDDETIDKAFDQLDHLGRLITKLRLSLDARAAIR